MKAINKSLKTKSINVIIPLVVYPFDVMLSVGEDDEAIKVKLDEFGIEYDESLRLLDTTLGRATLFPCNRSLIRLKRYPTTNTDHGIIAHEIFHVVDFLFERVGMKLSSDSGEAYAYLIGYLTEKVYESFT